MEQMFTLNTHALAYRIQETPGKDRILFLHGLGANLSQFDQEFSLLAEDYSVATLSLRGQGTSTRPAGDKAEDMTIPALASDVIQWMQAHRWENAHIVACSMGGVVALEILSQQSWLCRSLITFGTTPKLNFPRSVIRAAAWVSDMLLPGMFPEWMARTLPKTVSDNPETRRRFTEDLRTAFAQRKTIYQLRCELANYDYTHVLQTSSIPVLLLQGENDKDINKEIEKLWPLIGQNSLVQQEFMSDAGHIANYDQPQAFYASVKRFIDGHSS
ncbi:alpha/beta fold hydrolase [Spirochaeta dissipatitropha]